MNRTRHRARSADLLAGAIALLLVAGACKRAEQGAGPGQDTRARETTDTTPPGWLAGRVTDLWGKPLEGVTVAASTLDDPQALSSAGTGSTGRYRLRWDRKAFAKLWFSLPGYSIAVVEVSSPDVPPVSLTPSPPRDGLFLRGDTALVELEVKTLARGPAGARPRSHVIPADGFTKARSQRLRLYARGVALHPSHLVPLEEGTVSAIDGEPVGSARAQQVAAEKPLLMTDGGELAVYEVTLEGATGSRWALVHLMPAPQATPGCTGCLMPEKDQAVLLVVE